MPEACVMTRSAAIAAALAAFATLWSAAPASAQFYKGKTLTLIVNYGVGGNISPRQTSAAAARQT